MGHLAHKQSLPLPYTSILPSDLVDYSLFWFVSVSAPILKASQAVGKPGSSNSGLKRSQLKKLITETVDLRLPSLDNKAVRNSLEFIFYTNFYFLLVNFGDGDFQVFR